MFEKNHIFLIIANFLTRIYYLERLIKIEREGIPGI